MNHVQSILFVCVNNRCESRTVDIVCLCEQRMSRRREAESMRVREGGGGGGGTDGWMGG